MKFRYCVLLVLAMSAQALAQLPNEALKITRLTGDFYVFTTYNSYKGSLFPSNGMYLLTTEGAVMFDSPWDTTQFQPLLDSIQQRHHQTVVMCLATHSHEDRTGGLAYYQKQGIATYTTRQTDSICLAHHQKRAASLLEKDSSFTIGGHQFQTFYPGPGHTSDNIVVWFEKERILYGGCFVKSTEAPNLGNLADANLKAWPKSIRKVKKRFGKPDYVIPGHQDWQNKNSLNHTLHLLKLKRTGKSG